MFKLSSPSMMALDLHRLTRGPRLFDDVVPVASMLVMRQGRPVASTNAAVITAIRRFWSPDADGTDTGAATGADAGFAAGAGGVPPFPFGAVGLAFTPPKYLMA